jgi:hypothetical protein
MTGETRWLAPRAADVASADAPRAAVIMRQERDARAWRPPAAGRVAAHAARSRQGSAQLAGHGRCKQRVERGT